LGFSIDVLGSKVEGLGFGVYGHLQPRGKILVWGLGFQVLGLGFGVWGLGFMVYDWGLGLRF